MSHSFFHLTTPHQDHVCITRREVAAQEHLEYVESLPPAEHGVLQTQSCALANLLYRTINDHCEAEPDTSYGAIVEALMLVQARIDLEMREDDDTPAPEDCDA